MDRSQDMDKSKMFTRDRIRHTTMGLFFKELKDNSPCKEHRGDTCMR